MRGETIENLIDNFGKDIYKFCIYLTNNTIYAEELYLQTFLKLLEINKEINFSDNPKSYLFNICNNLYKNNKRKFGRHSRIAPECSLEEGKNERLIASDNTEESVYKELLKKEVNNVIKALPLKLKQVIILHYAFDYKIEDISTILKIPKGTVKSRLFKGREKIKILLEEKGYEEL